MEIDSKELKGIKGDLYIVNSGIHVLQMLSNVVIKTPVLQMSGSMFSGLKAAMKDGQNDSENKIDHEETYLNGKVFHLASDYMPVVGVSAIKNNLIMNFGVNPFQF